MYETLEFYDNNGCDLKEVLKSCIYKYYIAYKDLAKVSKSDAKNNIIYFTNKVNMLSTERR